MLSFIRDFIIMNHQKGELYLSEANGIESQGPLFLEFHSNPQFS